MADATPAPTTGTPGTNPAPATPPPAAPAAAAAPAPAKAGGTFLTDPPTPTPDKGTPGADAPKQDGPKQGEAAKAEGEKPKAEVTLKVPEGLQVDEAALGRLKALVADGKLPAETAQQLVDMEAESAKARQATRTQQVSAWLEQAKADTEFGGAKLQESHALASKAMAAYGTDAFRQVLNESGLGNHPEVIRAFVRIGRAMREDSVDGAGAKPTPTDSKEAQLRMLYPSMFKNS